MEAATGAARDNIGFDILRTLAAVVNLGTQIGDPNESEVDRYCSWPGQALGYEVGHQEIVRQRGRAQAELGGRYDLRDFNDAVVKGGNVPMDVLARNVSDYVATAGQAAAA